MWGGGLKSVVPKCFLVSGSLYTLNAKDPKELLFTWVIPTDYWY